MFLGIEYIIPSYQRKYSWEESNWEDLWSDIIEAFESETNHFLGTIILARKENHTVKLGSNDCYEIIDGQQRLTTLFLLLSELIKKIQDKSDEDEIKKRYLGRVLNNKINLKLTQLGKDFDFLQNLIFVDENIKAETRSQKLLKEAKQYFRDISQAYSKIDKLIIFIAQNIEVLVLTVKNQTEAIRMFEIINDRGKPLTLLDKTKSSLMLYSAMYLENEISNDINDAFEIIFNSFDTILDIGKQLNITYFVRFFNEDALLFQHYISYGKDISDKYKLEDYWSYRSSANDIFINFLKRNCNTLVKNKKKLKQFITEYINDFSEFAAAYAKLFQEIASTDDSSIVKPFRFLEFSATLYPLIVRLFQKKILFKLLPLLETIDIRVYKIRGTNPLRDMYTLSADVKNMNLKDIRNYLIWFLKNFMNDGTFKNYLNEDIYRNPAVKYILWEFNKVHGDFSMVDFNLYSTCDVEHIFSQDPSFGVTSYGFKKDDYEYHINRLGNLMLLEQDKNRSKEVGNKPPQLKVKFYLKSKLNDPKYMASYIKKEGYKLKDVNIRCQEIIDFCIDRWKIV